MSKTAIVWAEFATVLDRAPLWFSPVNGISCSSSSNITVTVDALPLRPALREMSHSCTNVTQLYKCHTVVQMDSCIEMAEGLDWTGSTPVTLN